MNFTKSFFLEIFYFVWQAPQYIIGLLFLPFIRYDEVFEYKGKKFIVSESIKGGISLGYFTFISTSLYENKDTNHVVEHEYGHMVQSMYLGWLYLLIIGLPSLIHAWTFKSDPSNPNKYYEFYTEKWADKLGGVER